jgi:hypothetical protein
VYLGYPRIFQYKANLVWVECKWMGGSLFRIEEYIKELEQLDCRLVVIGSTYQT